ncbi:Binding-protein-dependent transport systems inner membrane component [Rhodopseudomonas palustris HaA2]|uniref:Binding-protein-dependent transport systems inner membrane component n=1 Tax=Rhodopseudomonas palustris (strain HaA2) TaxID=316058 RepID=Q2IVG9_RHOP2|nr:ABC transporter permease [Rhodopseudomonas palustris]ABD07791.1 Binding-protein-dependent transport systems inner membrane component [Rhodopseudomonas palustris HaA2]
MSYWRRTEPARTIVVVLAVLTAIWELSVHLFGIRAFLLPAPSIVIADIVANPVFFGRQSLYTLYVTTAGFLIALIGGVLAAIAIVSSSFIDRTFYTLLVATNSIPKVALAPLFVIWLGTGGAPKIAIAAIIAIFPIVINTTVGLRAIDHDMIDLARSARASRLDIMMKVRFPNALPSLFAGAKIGVSFALIGAIVGEFVAGEQGLGYVILTSQATFNSTRAFAAIVVLGILGTIMFFAIEWIERWMLPWHVSQRAKTGH